MLLPAYRGVLAEQVPAEARSALEPLLRQLNPFMQSLASGLAHGLTFADNLNGQIKTLDVSVGSDWTIIGANGAPAWQAGWSMHTDATFEAPAYRRTLDGEVVFRGLAKSTAASTVALQLPATLRPAVSAGPFATNSNDAFASWDVSATGNVNYRAGSTAGWISMRGIRFEPANRQPAPPQGFPISYASTLSSSARVVWLGAAYALDASRTSPDLSVVLGPLATQWTEVSQKSPAGNTIRTIKVLSVSGLPPGRTYRLTFCSLGG